jgi:hypothetical protein
MVAQLCPSRKQSRITIKQCQPRWFAAVSHTGSVIAMTNVLSSLRRYAHNEGMNFFRSKAAIRLGLQVSVFAKLPL